MDVIDKKRFEEKLKDYERVDFKTLKVGDHMRYVKKNYNSETYKCVYAIIDNISDNVSVHGYVPAGSKDKPYSWTLSSKSIPYTRFYQKVKK